MRLLKVFAAGSVVYLTLSAVNLTRTAPPPATLPGELSPASKDGKWGYVTDQRVFIIKPQFDMAGPFAEGLAPVKEGDRVGYINRDGKWVIKPQFETAGMFSGGLAGVEKERGHFGFIDRSGTFIIPAKYEAVGSFSEGLASARSGGKYGYISHKGEWVVEPKYELAGPFSSGRAAVKLGGKYGYVDSQGKPVIESKFEWAGPFSEGLAAVRMRGKYGFVNHKGSVVIEPRFAMICGPFSEGLVSVLVEPEQKYAYIDTVGKVRIAPKFDAAGPFRKGFADARVYDEAVLLSSTGEISSKATDDGVVVHFATTPQGAELRITDELNWFVATDKDYLFSTLEPRPEGNTDKDIKLSKYTVWRVFFVYPGFPPKNRKVDPTSTQSVMVAFP